MLSDRTRGRGLRKAMAMEVVEGRVSSEKHLGEDGFKDWVTVGSIVLHVVLL